MSEFSILGMKKKRVDSAIGHSRKAQLTIFMIVGLILFFTFLFVIMLFSSVQKNQLEGEREKVYTRALEKEALRLYVQDCMEDTLVTGLQFLGKQGRIWADQGGVQEFAESVNGVQVGEDRIAYGIVRDTYEDYNEPEEKYPCPAGEGEQESPFCKYTSADTSIVFGRKKLWLSSMEKDLQEYLKSKTVSCIGEYLKKEISSAAKLQSGEIDLRVAMTNEGVNVNVHYPLRFSMGNEEFFHLSEFDFFYTTQFKEVLDVAILRPLDEDWIKVDFIWDEETLTNPERTPSGLVEKYNQLGIQYNSIKLDNGDTLFEFRPTWTEEKLRDIVIRVARQNRPPALDYISRCPGKDYDYLVLPGESNQINIPFTATDPDEDPVNLLSPSGTDMPVNPSPTFSSVITNLNIPESNHLSIIVQDSRGLQDSQDVRFKVDSPTSIPSSSNLPLVSHCCIQDANSQQGWRVAREGEAYCVLDNPPIFGCFGKVSQVTTPPFGFAGYVLEDMVGNCGGEYADTCTPSNLAILRGGTLHCGFNDDRTECPDSENPTSLPGCSGIDCRCENSDAFGLQPRSGWCHGTMGCADFCTTAIVADEGSPVVSHDYNYPITVRANSLIATSDNVLALHCGCTAGDINKFCDKTFDGIFEGKCNADGDCKPPLAAVQQRPLSS